MNRFFRSSKILYVNVILFFLTGIPFQFPYLLAQSSIDAIKNEKLPEDKTIKKGVLPNGMTYYLHATDVVKERASFYIIQNVGSILENDDQQGLAHFLEHMAFNGTESFEGKAFLNKMQENGLLFGRDINAYTSFDETVYNISNVPTTPELINDGLQILRDWSNYLLLTDEEIDAERGVIKEEWRTRNNGGYRITQQTISALYGESKYAQRIPIGLMDIVENFEYKALRDFYHDWYRTDLQAIAVIGDIDVDDMEAKIKDKFSSIPKVEDPLERYYEKIKDKESLSYILAMDDEVHRPMINFQIRRKDSNDGVKGSLSRLYVRLVDGLISSMLNTRLYKHAQEPEASFLRISYQNGLFARGYKNSGFYIFPKENKQQEAFQFALTEFHRALKFGFTDTEITIALEKVFSEYENAIAAKENRQHKAIAELIKSNFLEGSHMSDLKQEYEVAKKIIESLTNTDFIKRLNNLYTAHNRVIAITGVKGQDNLLEDQVMEIFSQVENATDLKPYENQGALRDLMEDVSLIPGTIKCERKKKTIGYTKFTLSNGIEVYHKYSDKTKNTVQFRAISKGGKSLVVDDDVYKTNFATSLVALSGANKYTSTEVSDILAGKKVSVNSSIGRLEETVVGGAVTKDVETLLQLVNLRFSKPRFDKNSFDLLMESAKNNLESKKNSLPKKMQDSITVSFFGKNNPTRKIITKELIDAITFEDLKRIYLNRFDNAADFRFFVIGDVPKETIVPYIEKYLASIKTSNSSEEWEDNYLNWLTNTVNKDVYLAMENPKHTVQIGYKKQMKVSRKDAYIANIFQQILDLRFTESLREDEGGTYGASATAFIEEEPRNTANIRIGFDCNPELSDKLIAIVYQEIEKIKKGDIQKTDFDKAIQNLKKDRLDAKNTLSYDISRLMTYVQKGFDRDKPKYFDKIIDSITTKDIQKFVNKVTTNTNSYKIVFKPKS